MSLYHHAGLQRTHPDLNANFVSKTIMSSCSDKVVDNYCLPPIYPAQDWTASLNTVDGSSDPSPSSYYNNHGTSCAGIIAMEKSNDHCGVGVAHHANLGGQSAFTNTVGMVVFRVLISA